MARDDAFKRPRRLETKYRDEIDALLDRYFKLPTTRGLGEITARLVEWGQLDQVFRRYAERTASSMVKDVAVENAKSWRKAAGQGTNAQRIHLGMQALLHGPIGAVFHRQVAESADYITRIPKDVSLEAVAFIADQQTRGVRADDIARALAKKLPEYKRGKIDVIARTQVAKADTALTRVRATSMRLNWYEWVTSEDMRVRKAHRKMDHVLVNWDDPPAPEALVGVKSTLGHYHAGECPNCRCPALPLVTVNDVSWPHKVYTGGRIVRMTRPQFLELAPGYRLAA